MVFFAGFSGGFSGGRVVVEWNIDITGQIIIIHEPE